MEFYNLKTLSSIPSPSGMEKEAVDFFEEILPKPSRIYSDKIGNRAFFYGHGPTKILLSAHIDEVQARVTYISDDGILSVVSTGGICKKSLIASYVQIIADNGRLITGIVEKTPIHCEVGDSKDKVEEIDEFKVNLGYDCKEDVESLGVHVGSILIYRRNYEELGDSKICGCGMDDKSGVFICEQIIKKLVVAPQKKEEWMSEYTVIVLAATQEETGLRGAKVAAAALNPDISIDFDVTFACSNGNGVKKEKYGEIKLGKGGVIQFGPDKSERLNSILIETAELNGIKYQRGVSRAGGTNTNAIQLFSKDCETTLISIPNKNMHTPIEMVDKKDIESIVDLVATAIKNKSF